MGGKSVTPSPSSGVIGSVRKLSLATISKRLCGNVNRPRDFFIAISQNDTLLMKMVFDLFEIIFLRCGLFRQVWLATKVVHVYQVSIAPYFCSPEKADNISSGRGASKSLLILIRPNSWPPFLVCFSFA